MDEVYLLYNEFKSVIQQKIVVERLLPIRASSSSATEPALDYIYEPAPADIFERILPRHVEIQVWRALLESRPRSTARAWRPWTPPPATPAR